MSDETTQNPAPQPVESDANAAFADNPIRSEPFPTDAEPSAAEKRQDDKLEAVLSAVASLGTVVMSLAKRVDTLSATPAPAAPVPATVAAPPEPVEHKPLGEGQPMDRLHAIESRLLAWEPVLAELASVAGSFVPGGLGAMLKQLGNQLGHNAG